MTDSVRYLHHDVVNTLDGELKFTGKLRKGKAINASIPSSHQTVVHKDSEKKGFSSQAKRFDYGTHLNENPGPGSYLGLSSMETDSVSFSRRGTGMIASKNTRLIKQGTSLSPSPNAYNIAHSFQSRCDFNQSAVSRLFHLPIAVERPKTFSPAPNSYNILDVETYRTNNVSANAAFKSKTSRNTFLYGGDRVSPSPCK